MRVEISYRGDTDGDELTSFLSNIFAFTRDFGMRARCSYHRPNEKLIYLFPVDSLSSPRAIEYLIIAIRRELGDNFPNICFNVAKDDLPPIQSPVLDSKTF